MSGPRSAIELLGGAARVAEEGVLLWADDVRQGAEQRLGLPAGADDHRLWADSAFAAALDVAHSAGELVARAAQLLEAFDAASAVQYSP